MLSQGYFKLREKQAYLEMQNKLWEKLPRSTKTPPMITMDEE